ncbi:MAG TPA: phosphate signaling complex protein PhoU [Polyangia bacterium]|nr:phosphate signaling complex protein PhoU [Polyangia bacterium]
MTDLRPHTSQDFEAELAAVREKVLAMGRKVDEVVEAAGRALVARDVALANRIVLGDEETDAMELDLDHLCLEVLARRQPVADDLRLLLSALKIVVDLERVGDLGVSIATRVVELGAEPPLIPYDNVLAMLTTARGMVSEALEALMRADAARARAVIEKDDIVDAYATRVFDDVVSATRADTRNVSRAIRVQAIAKYAERIGDHGTNVAERVIFVLTGDDIRHRPRPRRLSLS